MTLKERFWAYYWIWCERAGPILLVVCFIAMSAFALMAKGSVASVCEASCYRLGGNQWTTGSFGLECYCNAPNSSVREVCTNTIFNGSISAPFNISR